MTRRLQLDDQSLPKLFGFLLCLILLAIIAIVLAINFNRLFSTEAVHKIPAV